MMIKSVRINKSSNTVKDYSPLIQSLLKKKKKEIFPVWVFTFTLNLSVHYIQKKTVSRSSVGFD